MDCRSLLHFVRCWISCQNQWGGRFVPPLSHAWLGLVLIPFILDSGSDGSHSFIWLKLKQQLLCRFWAQKYNLNGTLEGAVARSSKCSSSSGMPAENHTHPWPLLSLSSGQTPFFFLLSNLSLPVTAHFNLLCLYHATFATFFWLNIEPCWSPPTQPTSLLFCITPSCSTRHEKTSLLLEEEALRRAFLLLVQSGAQ